MWVTGEQEVGDPLAEIVIVAVVLIPDSVTSWGVEAFRDCSGLTAVIIRVSEAEGDYPDFSSSFPDGVPVEYQTLLLTTNLAPVSI